MKTNNELSTWKQFALAPYVQGPILGAGMMFTITPGLNWTNQTLKGQRLQLRHAMDGCIEYSSSALPTYAVVFCIKKWLQRSKDETSVFYDTSTSFFAGATSGFASTPFESNAQNKQLSQSLSSKETLKQIIKYNGKTALLRGATTNMLREGMWSTVYMTAAPTFSHYFETQNHSKAQSEGLALILTAGLFGLFSTPLNQLRFKKQQGLTEPCINKSYLEHTKDIWNQNPNARTSERLGHFFKAWPQRVITTTAAGAVIVEGQKLYNHMVMTSKF